jgi:hypothetical protein
MEARTTGAKHSPSGSRAYLVYRLRDSAEKLERADTMWVQTFPRFSVRILLN